MSRIYELLHKSSDLPDVYRPAVPREEARDVVSRPTRTGPRTLSASSDIALFAGVLRRQWRIAVLCTLGLTAAALVATLLMKPVYEPQARLEVDPPGNEEFSLAPQAVSGETEYLQTQTQNLQSDALALAVIRELRLASDLKGAPTQNQRESAQDPQRLTPSEAAALRNLHSRLKVEHDPGSRVIAIAVGDHDPVQAATITNTLARLYVERMAEARNDAITQSVNWLSKQLKDVRNQMNDSNHALANFQQANGVAEVEEGRSTYGEMLADLNRQRTQTAADRIQLEALLNKVHENDPDSLPQVHESVLIQQLTQKLAEVRSQLAESRAIYGPNHPNIKRLENQRDEFQTQLNKQKKNILDEVKTAYSAARAREELMSREVSGTTRQLSLVAQYNALKREAQANTELYNTLYSKVEEAAISAASKSSNIRVVDPARVLDKPTRPRRLFNLALGLLAGLTLGIVAAFIFEGLDTRVRGLGDVLQCAEALSVSIVPVIERNGNSRRVLGTADGNGITAAYEPLLLSRPFSAEAEAVRGLRTSLILSRLNQPPQALLIASSLPGEGKTTVALNLAVALSQHGRTCIVDCDWRKSMISSILAPSSGPGLGDVLMGNNPLLDAIHPTEIPNLSVLRGHISERAHELFTRFAMKQTVETLREEFKFIILDSPPILPYTDGRILATIVDGIVFVGRPHVTTRDAMTRSLELLAQVRSAPILEVVLNAANEDTEDYRYYRYAYQEKEGA